MCCFGGHSERETPGHIPNPEAKTLSADGTAGGTLWESRTPPDSTVGRGHPPRRVASFLFPHSYAVLRDSYVACQRGSRHPPARNSVHCMSRSLRVVAVSGSLHAPSKT